MADITPTTPAIYRMNYDGSDKQVFWNGDYATALNFMDGDYNTLYISGNWMYTGKCPIRGLDTATAKIDGNWACIQPYPWFYEPGTIKIAYY